MGLQQPTADEVLLARAEANDYRRGVHRESDEVRGREKHVTKTKKNQDGTLRRYILYVRGAEDRDLLYFFSVLTLILQVASRGDEERGCLEGSVSPGRRDRSPPAPESKCCSS